MPTLIKQSEHPVLRQKSPEVPPSWPDLELSKIIDTMRAALAAESDGVALAAPQIGVSLRIFITSPNANPEQPEGLVFINPKIVKSSRREVELVEGCLSVRGIYGKIKRREKVTVRALGQDGRPFTRHMSGLLAQIAQHEIDHLDGKLFTDKAYDFFKLSPEEYGKNRE